MDVHLWEGDFDAGAVEFDFDRSNQRLLGVAEVLASGPAAD